MRQACSVSWRCCSKCCNATRRPKSRCRCWPRWAVLSWPPWWASCCRLRTNAAWCWWMVSSPPLRCWWRRAYSRRCCSAASFPTPRASLGMRCCCTTWGCRHCSIGSCVWGKVRARHWLGRCWIRPAASCATWPALPKRGSLRAAGTQRHTHNPDRNLALAPGRGAFLGKGLCALLGVGIHHVGGHGLPRQLVGGLNAHLALAVEHGFAHTHRGAGFVQDGSEQLFDLRIQRFRRHHPVEQAVLECGLGVDEITGQQHFHGPLHGHVAHQGHAG